MVHIDFGSVIYYAVLIGVILASIIAGFILFYGKIYAIFSKEKLELKNKLDEETKKAKDFKDSLISNFNKDKAAVVKPKKDLN